MKFLKRLRNLEKNVQTKKSIPAVAVRYLDGSLDWAGRIFPNEEEFDKAVERAFKDESPAPGQRVIVISFLRKMKDINLTKNGKNFDKKSNR